METQLAQIATRLQEQEAANAQLSDENVILRERIALQESQLAHYQQSHTATQELMIQLEVRNLHSYFSPLSYIYNCVVEPLSDYK